MTDEQSGADEPDHRPAILAAIRLCPDLIDRPALCRLTGLTDEQACRALLDAAAYGWRRERGECDSAN